MTLIGIKARNHPQQIAELGVDDSVDDRRTPAWLFRELHARYHFTLDAAASDENAQLPDYYTRAENGLEQKWAGHRVWCNPPYSDCAAWVEKAWRAMRGECDLVVMLLPADRTDQKWWHTYIEPHRDRSGWGVRLRTEFLEGRIRFGRPGGSPPVVGGDRPPFGLVLAIWARTSDA